MLVWTCGLLEHIAGGHSGNLFCRIMRRSDTHACPCWPGGEGGRSPGGGKGGGGHEAMVLVCLPLAAPIGLSPSHSLTLCGSERVLVVSTEPPDDLSCLTGRLSQRQAVARLWKEGGGGAGTTPGWIAVCSWRHPLASRHLPLSFP